jgi:TRAP-type mannitol/chloroaromatic compound transport system permease small subunit|tara:strand:- start:42448 stop:42906 length:459 start_codon:yes stop_codon:yes gene_type:complete
LKSTSYLGRFFLLALMMTILVDVIGRRFINTSSVSLQELEWHLHGALFLLCLGFTYMKDAHVRVDLLREKFTQQTNRLIEVVGCLFFLLPYCGVVIYFGIDFTVKSYLAGEMSATADGLPYRFIIKSCLPLGFLLLGLSAISVLLKQEKSDA